MTPLQNSARQTLNAISETRVATVIELCELAVIPAVNGLRDDVKSALLVLKVSEQDIEYYLDYFKIGADAPPPQET